MWGNRSAQMYLGRSMCLLKAKGQPLLRIEHSPTMPLPAVLDQLTERCMAIGIPLSGLSLQVDLSAALCQGHVVTTQFSQLTSAIKGQIAHIMRIPQSNLALQQCATHPQLFAGTTQALVGTLSAWAALHRAKLDSVQPLWAGVTQAGRAKLNDAVAIVLLEPDGCTLLSQGSPPASAPIWQYTTIAQNDSLQEMQVQLLNTHALQASQVATFKFHARDDHASERGLFGWLGHWEAV